MKWIISLFKGKVWWKTFQITAFVVFFTMIPLMVGVVKWLFLNKNVNFYIEGEFFTYSISLLTASMLVYLSRSSLKDAFGFGAFIWSIIILFVLSFLYATLALVTDTVSYGAVFWSSSVLFTITLIQFYHAQYVLNSRSPDIGEQRREEADNIADALN